MLRLYSLGVSAIPSNPHREAEIQMATDPITRDFPDLVIAKSQIPELRCKTKNICKQSFSCEVQKAKNTFEYYVSLQKGFTIS